MVHVKFITCKILQATCKLRSEESLAAPVLQVLNIAWPDLGVVHSAAANSVQRCDEAPVGLAEDLRELVVLEAGLAPASGLEGLAAALRALLRRARHRAAGQRWRGVSFQVWTSRKRMEGVH